MPAIFTCDETGGRIFADVSLAGPCRLADGGAGHRWQWREVWLVRQDKKGHVLEDVHIALVQAVKRLVSVGAQGGLGATEQVSSSENCRKDSGGVQI